jgi:hypothetical protein
VSPGNLELARVLASWAATLPTVATILLRDERRLEGEALARAWPPQSRDAAIFGLWLFGLQPFCVLMHFARTRRSTRGVVVGLLWLCVVFAIDIGAQIGAAVAIDWFGL